MNHLCETCRKEALQCWCEYKCMNGFKPWINAWSRKIHDDRINENKKFIEENFPKTVKSFESSKSGCEGVQNFEKSEPL